MLAKTPENVRPAGYSNFKVPGVEITQSDDYGDVSPSASGEFDGIDET